MILRCQCGGYESQPASSVPSCQVCGAPLRSSLGALELAWIAFYCFVVAGAITHLVGC